MRMLIILLCISMHVTAQKKELYYTNYGKEFKTAIGTFRSNSIHEIKVSDDSTFEFTSRPAVSCLLWRNFKGRWKKENDTLYFWDEYQVDQKNTTSTYSTDQRQSFFIGFCSDKHLPLTNKKMQVAYIYDHNSKLPDVERDFTLSTDNKLQIPFKDIPHYELLAAIKIDYLLNGSESRSDYLTTNRFLNMRQHDIPNIISVMFVEEPKHETVYRLTKGLIRDGKLFIISTKKSGGILKDYGEDFKFEDGYTLEDF